MLEHDRVFLRDFVSLTFKNHVMAVEALFRAGQQGREFAQLTLRRMSPTLSAEDAVSEEAETNEGTRFQAVMFAKILAEFVGALEDYGALCHAIRARANRGILREFLISDTAASANCFDYFLAHPQADLGELLGLPSLEELQSRLNAEDHAMITEHYRGGATVARDLARIYREPPVAGSEPGLLPLRDDWQECVHVLLNVVGDRRGARGVFPWAFNKIKHRFAVLESVELYAQLPIAAQLEVVAVNKRDERVALLVDATRNASLAAAEIAAALSALDERGALE